MDETSDQHRQLGRIGLLEAQLTLQFAVHKAPLRQHCSEISDLLSSKGYSRHDAAELNNA